MITKTGSIITKNLYENKDGSSYTVTGTLTNNDGVFSGFSAANYIMTNCSVSCTSDKLEIFGSYTTSSDITSEQYVFDTSARCLALVVVGSKFRLQTYANSAWTNSSGSTTLATNTKYFFKVISDNTTIKLYVWLNGCWVQDCSITLPAAQTAYTLGIGTFIPNTSIYARGTIDLKDYTINISGKTAWSGIDALMTNGKAKIGKNFVASDTFYEY